MSVAPEFTFNQWRERVANVSGDVLWPGPDSDAVVSRWFDAISEAYTLARADRLKEIRGDHRTRAFNAEGIHPFSRAWGVVQACEDLLPGLSALRRPEGGVALEAWTVRRLAARDANERAAVALATADPQEWWA